MEMIWALQMGKAKLGQEKEKRIEDIYPGLLDLMAQPYKQQEQQGQRIKWQEYFLEK